MDPPLLGTPDSLMIPSEPPDMKNWWSSYEYESLVLETNDNFGFSDNDNENTVESSRAFASENGGKMKEKTSSNQSQVLDSPLLSSVESEPPGIEKWFCSYAYESPAPDTMDHVILCDPNQSMADKEECCNGKLQLQLQRKKVEKVDGKGMMINCNQRQEEEECDNNGSTKDGKESNGNESADENHDAEKEERKEEGVGNGFVSVKKSIMHGNENRSSSSSSSSSCVVGNGNGKMKKDEDDENERRGRSKRRALPLGDMTNIEPGKWKCPRKTKPHIPPPLKQLQLGQWFHRQ